MAIPVVLIAEILGACVDVAQVVRWATGMDNPDPNQQVRWGQVYSGEGRFDYIDRDGNRTSRTMKYFWDTTHPLRQYMSGGGIDIQVVKDGDGPSTTLGHVTPGGFDRYDTNTLRNAHWAVSISEGEFSGTDTLVGIDRWALSTNRYNGIGNYYGICSTGTVSFSSWRGAPGGSMVNVDGGNYSYNDLRQMLVNWGNDNLDEGYPPITITDTPTLPEALDILDGGDEPGPGPDPEEPEDPDTNPADEADSGSIDYNSVGPVIGGLSSFLTSYGLNASQINALGYDLWSKVISNNESDQMLANFYKVSNTQADYTLTLAEILDYFVSLKWFPFTIGTEAETITTGEKGIRVGTGATLISTNPNLADTYTLSNPIVYLDGGELWLPYTYNSYMDFEPYTSVSIYVPYCGTQELQPSLVIGRKLKLTYCVDMLTGACTAIVMGQGQQGDSEEHLSNFQTPVAVLHGVIGFEIAMTGNTQNAQTRNALAARDNYVYGQFNSIASGVAKGIGTAATGLNTMNLLGGQDYGADLSLNEQLSNFAYDVGKLGFGGAMSEVMKYNSGFGSSIVGARTGLASGAQIGSALGNAYGQKILYENQLPFIYGTQPLIVGSNSNMSSLILPQKAFVQIRRRNRLKATNYYLSNGYTEARTYRLSTLGGFTMCLNPKLDFAATETELNEIYELLSTGVYLPLVEEEEEEGN